MSNNKLTLIMRNVRRARINNYKYIQGLERKKTSMKKKIKLQDNKL